MNGFDCHSVPPYDQLFWWWFFISVVVGLWMWARITELEIDVDYWKKWVKAPPPPRQLSRPYAPTTTVKTHKVSDGMAVLDAAGAYPAKPLKPKYQEIGGGVLHEVQVDDPL